MTKDLRYLRYQEKFLEYSCSALRDQFESRDDLVSFFQSIPGDARKDLFLKTASFYLFLVKKGDWIVDIPGSDRKLSYLTDTYKYIAIFSLIESLQVDEFIDFYAYLVRKSSQVRFPINDKKELDNWYRRYKAEFGSIQHCVAFFMGLSANKQAILVRKLRVKDAQPAVEELAKYLYELRSKFVHQAELVLTTSGVTTVSANRNKIMVSQLSMQDLMGFFEDGLVNYFDER